MSRRHAVVAFAVSLAAFAGCTPDTASDRLLVRDSAGVRIVESRAPGCTPEKQRVDTAPVLTIGAESGEQEYLFSLIRSVIRLDDGRIVVGDGGSRQVRFYDSTGRFLGATGRAGQGPGEFGTWVLRLWPRPPSEIWVNDDANGRINIVSTSGSFLGSVRILAPAVAPRASPVGLFSDGTILGRGIVGGAHTQPAGRPGDVHRSQWVYLRYDSTGRYLGESIRSLGQAEYAHAFMGTTTFSAIPFTQAELVSVHGNALAVYRGPGNEIGVWTQAGQLQRIIRWSTPPRPVRDVWERYKVASLERRGLTAIGREHYREFHELSLPLPEHLPAIEAVMSDTEGRIWARRYRLLWETAQIWDVFEPDGEWCGTITTPPNLTVYHIGADFVLGVHRDELDVERVRLHALIRP
jgi:hypothetical protein